MDTRLRRFLAGASLCLAMVLAGCTSTAPGGAQATKLPTGTSYGVVESIQPTEAAAAASGPSGVGAAVGSVLGSVLGYHIGSGGGQVAASAAGAAGGALAGNAVERKRAEKSASGYQIGVRLDNGNFANLNQADVGDLAVGNRVRIDDGRVSRY